MVTTVLDELERMGLVTQRERFDALDVLGCLAEIRDRKLYRGTHSTFEDYCRERWGISQALLDMLAPTPVDSYLRAHRGPE